MSRRIALLVGTTKYADSTWKKLDTPSVDVSDFVDLLKSPEIGHFDEVETLVNEPYNVVNEKIATFFFRRKTDDLLLLYLSGHGEVGADNQLYLVATNTQRYILSTMSIPASVIIKHMDECGSKRKILVLDCCFSGAVIRGSKNGIGQQVVTEETFKGKNGYGKVILTATTAQERAWEGDKVIDQSQNSLFTHFLLEGLRTGEADRDNDKYISVDEWYNYAYDHIIRITELQTPQIWNWREGEPLIVADNIKFHLSSQQRTNTSENSPEDEKQVIHTFWARSQLMRVTIKVNPGSTWELMGVPANSPELGDEILESQVQLLEEYQKYGLYEVHGADRLMGLMEGMVGSLVNSNRNRQAWKRRGIYDSTGKAIEDSK